MEPNVIFAEHEVREIYVSFNVVLSICDHSQHMGGQYKCNRMLFCRT